MTWHGTQGWRQGVQASVPSLLSSLPRTAGPGSLQAQGHLWNLGEVGPTSLFTGTLAK